MTGAGTGLAGGGVVVDARGLLCPAPIIKLARAARTLPAGTVVTVLATDPAAAVDVPAWARMRGHTVVEAAVEAGAGTGHETTKDGDLVIAVLLGEPTVS